MKKIVLISLTLSLLLAGCFSNNAPASPTAVVPQADAPKEVSVNITNKQQATVTPTANSNQKLNVDAPIVTQEQQVSDSEIYAKAFSAKNPSLCAEIKDSSLKNVCVTESAKK